MSVHHTALEGSLAAFYVLMGEYSTPRLLGSLARNTNCNLHELRSMAAPIYIAATGFFFVAHYLVKEMTQRKTEQIEGAVHPPARRTGVSQAVGVASLIAADLVVDCFITRNRSAYNAARLVGTLTLNYLGNVLRNRFF